MSARRAHLQAVGAAPDAELRRLYEAKLAESGLTPDDAAKLGIDLLPADDVAALGRTFERRGALRIRYFDARRRAVKGMFRVRYLEDPVGFAARSAKPKRYAQPPDTPPAAYFPTGVGVDWAATAKDPTKAVVITEGELKAVCAAKSGFPTIGLGGVWSFRSAPRGIAFLPELEEFDWAGRRVTIVFDSDVAAKPEVRRALRALARELKARGADAKEARLPGLKGLEKTGLDDYLVREKRAAFETLLESAGPALVAEGPAAADLDAALEYLDDRAAIVLGNSPVIVTEGEDAFGPRFVFMSPGGARTWFADVTYRPTGADGSEKTKPAINAWFGLTRRRFKGVDVMPVDPRPGVFNTWRGFAVEPAPGDWSLLDRHLRGNVCRNDDEHRWLIAWLAHVVQRPHQKTGVALVLRGDEGVGKTIVGKALRELFHPLHHASISKRNQLIGQFNRILLGAVVVQFEEAFWAGDRMAEGILKDLITSTTMVIEPKGVDAFTASNLVNVVITSNYDWVVPASHSARRFTVLDVRDDHREDHAYFGAIERQLDAGGRAGLLYDLLHLDLTKYPNPRRHLDTPGLAEQKLASLNDFERWWLAALTAGKFDAPPYDGALTGDWPTTVPTETLRRSYREFRSKSRRRDASPDPDNTRAFGRALKRVCPGAERSQKEYALPSRKACIEAFEKAYGLTVESDEDDE